MIAPRIVVGKSSLPRPALRAPQAAGYRNQLQMLSFTVPQCRKTMFRDRLNRLFPYLFLATGIVAVIQLATTLGHFAQKHGLAGWVVHNGRTLALILAGLAVLAWLFVLAGALRRNNRLPKFLTERRWLMDILDRLTNRAELERRLSQDVESIFVDAEALAATLKSKVVGEDRICDDLAAQIRRRLALKQRGKPIGVFLFAGPPGSGKTWLGKVLAEALGKKLMHFDMTQFSAGGYAATSMFGAGKGYVGSQEYGKLTGGLRDTPDAVVLLDEIEKAHGDVHKNFLTAWNDGFLTEKSDGKQISTTRAIFVLTTNAALDTLAELAVNTPATPTRLGVPRWKRCGPPASRRKCSTASIAFSYSNRFRVWMWRGSPRSRSSA
jgi:hypothetical protein